MKSDFDERIIKTKNKKQLLTFTKRTQQTVKTMLLGNKSEISKQLHDEWTIFCPPDIEKWVWDEFTASDL